MASLIGARAKIARAQHHFDDLSASLGEWGAPRKVTTKVAIEDKPEGKYSVVSASEAPPPPELPLLIGDAIHNLRSALDHLVCQLAVKAGNPLACSARQIDFPIFDQWTADREKRFVSLGKWIGVPAIDAIKDEQPYNRRPFDALSDPLWLVKELDNIDKHRTVIVTVEHIAHAKKVPHDDGGYLLIRPEPGDSWESEVDGKQFLNARFRINESESKMDGKHLVERCVRFKETGLPACDGHRVKLVIPELIEDVSRLVDRFDKAFF